MAFNPPTNKVALAQVLNPANLDIFQAIGPGGDIMSRMDYLGGLYNSFGQLGNIFVVTTNFSESQLLSLSGGTSYLPVTPNPGPGNAIVPTYWTFNYVFNSTPYVIGGGGTALAVALPGSTPGSAPFGSELTGTFDQTESIFYSDSAGPFQSPSSIVTGQPLVANIQGDTPTISGGDGSLIIKIWFSVVPVF